MSDGIHETGQRKQLPRLDHKLLDVSVMDPGSPDPLSNTEVAEVHIFPANAPARYGEGSILAGKYRLDSQVGEGAMGTVWEATNLLLDCRVAIKLTHSELTGPSYRERLQLEARAAAALGHPGVVRVFDVGETELGDPFIVMELLKGGTLSRMLESGRLPATRAVQIVLPIVDALAAMHARGIVHRDVKPENLFIAQDDHCVQPKLLDFGIAKCSDLGSSGSLDEPGALVGSPEYMSPEQAEASADVDFRTDIWSVCVVLYEAMAGEPPFRGYNAVELLCAIVGAEPLSLARRGVCDEELWEIIRTGLAKDRSERHGSMLALGAALARWLLGRGVAEDVCGTAVEAKWFPSASPSSRADASATVAEASQARHDPGSARTLPPRSAASRLPAYRVRLSARKARAWALAAAAVAAYFLVASRHGAGEVAVANALGSEAAAPPQHASAEASPAEASRFPGALLQGTSSLAPVPEVTPLDAPPPPEPSVEKIARKTLAVAAVRKPALASAASPLHKPMTAQASGNDLGLIAPY